MVEQTTSAQRAPRHTDDSPARETAAGSNGTALTPPVYGIDFVDQVAFDLQQPQPAGIARPDREPVSPPLVASRAAPQVVPLVPSETATSAPIETQITPLQAVPAIAPPEEQVALPEAQVTPEAESPASAQAQSTPRAALQQTAPVPVPVSATAPAEAQVAGVTEPVDRIEAPSEETTAPELPPGESPAAPAAGEGAAPVEVELLMPEPPTELSPAAQQRLAGVRQRTRATAATQATMPSAARNVAGARQAVTEPEAETTARVEGALVEALGERPAPSPEIEALCVRIRDVIQAQRPPDEDALVEADPEQAALDAGRQLDESVEGDINRVQGSYDQLGEQQTGTPATTPQPLAAQPPAQQTADIDAASAAPEPVSAEDVSLDADVEASQQRMDEAGMNTEPAQLVRSGPIAEARAVQGELEETAQRDPQVVLAEQAEAIASARTDMTALQARALAALQEARNSTTTRTERQQRDMIASEEDLRARIGQQAQAIFDRTQTQVEAQLRELPRMAQDRWATGVERLSTEFRQRLRHVEEWLEERYRGVGGTLLQVGEMIVGMPEWVEEEYNTAEQQFGDGACRLLREISREVNGVIATCQALIEQAHRDIAALYDPSSLPAGLREWAQQQQAQFESRLNALSERALEVRDNINTDLTDRASRAVDEVRAEIHELREQAGGLLGQIMGAVESFLEDPVRFIINGLLELANISPASFWALVERIQQVIADIAGDPMNFINNLVEALKQGFQGFFDNISQHLLQGLLEWLFGAMGNVGVTIPSDLSLESIITFFLQLMGITWERIRRLLARHVGEENVALIEQAWELISTLIQQGPAGIFEMIREQLDPQAILDMVLQTAIDFVIETLIRQVAVRIIGMLNPVGLIAQAIELIYRILRWIFENAARIFTLVETIVNGAADLIAGNLSGMAGAIEGALARLVPIVIDFLAGLLGLGDLPDRIADTVRRLQNWVEGILDRVIGWLAERARILWEAAMARVDSLAGRDREQAAQEGPESPEAQAVKQEALQTARQRLAGSRIQTFEQVNTILAEVEEIYRERGLVGLSARIDSEESLDITLVASASPSSEAEITWQTVFAQEDLDTSEMQELRQAFIDPNSVGFAETSAFITVGGENYGVISRSTAQGHAEEALITSSHFARAVQIAADLLLEGSLAEGRMREQVDIVLGINRTPCHSICTPLLVNVILQAKRYLADRGIHRGVHFILAASTPYFGSPGQPPTETIDPYVLELQQLMPDLERAIELTDPDRLRGGVERDQLSGRRTREATRTEDIGALEIVGWDVRILNAGGEYTTAQNLLAGRITRIKRLLQNDNPISEEFKRVMETRRSFMR